MVKTYEFSTKTEKSKKSSTEKHSHTNTTKMISTKHLQKDYRSLSEDGRAELRWQDIKSLCVHSKHFDNMKIVWYEKHMSRTHKNVHLLARVLV